MRIAQDSRNPTNSDFDDYVILVLWGRQGGKCVCGASLDEGFQITHKRYGEDITVNDLELRQRQRITA